MATSPVIRNCSYCLVHVPDLVQYGSKPRREIREKPSTLNSITHALRTYNKALCYPPNQTFIGNLSPDELKHVPRPWFEKETPCSSKAKFGEVLDQTSFYALLKAADVQNPPLFAVDEAVLSKLRGILTNNPLLSVFASKFAAVSPNAHLAVEQNSMQSSALQICSEGKNSAGFMVMNGQKGGVMKIWDRILFLKIYAPKPQGPWLLPGSCIVKKLIPERLTFSSAVVKRPVVIAISVAAAVWPRPLERCAVASMPRAWI